MTNTLLYYSSIQWRSQKFVLGAQLDIFAKKLN